MTDKEKIERNKQIKDKMETDNKKMLEDLIELIEEKIRKIDLSDEYLKELNVATREEIGIGEYSYGISMIPCESVYPFLLDLQIKNKTIKTQQAEIEKYKMMLAENHARALNNVLKQMHKHEEDLEALHLGWKEEAEKKDIIINKMAEHFYLSWVSEEYKLRDIKYDKENYKKTIKNIKEYFTNKVEKEK